MERSEGLSRRAAARFLTGTTGEGKAATVPNGLNRWTVGAAVATTAVLSVGVTALASAALHMRSVAQAAPAFAAPLDETGADTPAPASGDARRVSTRTLHGGAAAWSGAPEPTAMSQIVDVGNELAAPPPPLPKVHPWLAPTVALPDPSTAPLLGVGDSSPEVTVLEQRLTELGYRPGEVDDYFSYQTWSAVLAFQKAENLERSGDVDRDTWARLPAPKAWSITAASRGPAASYPRVEVDIERQVVLVILGPENVHTLNTSTGGGYAYRNEYGSTEIAETPLGDYQVYLAYNGTMKAPLGSLYRPLYFHRGYAIHGSPYVPSYPDSHGCVRLANADMDWLFDLAPDNMAVNVYETMNPWQVRGGYAEPGLADPGAAAATGTQG